MKTDKTYSILIAILSISLFSCDVIEEPFMVVQEEVSDSCEAFIFSPVENYTKKVYLKIILDKPAAIAQEQQKKRTNYKLNLENN